MKSCVQVRALWMFVIIAMVLFSTVVQAAPAAGPDTVLILSTTVSGGAASLEATKAIALGMTVEVVDAATWAGKSTSDFASYRALILGDPTCGESTSIFAAAEANASTWAPAVTGNVIVIGTDPVYHSSSGGSTLTGSGIEFALDVPDKTGAYITLSCAYHSSPSTVAPVLGGFGTFMVRGGLGCFDDAHIVAAHPALAGSTDETLSNWGCSVHEVFESFPSTFAPLAIGKGITGAGSLTFPDQTSGVPYIIARGEDLVTIGCGNGIIETGAGEECDDGNTVGGDGCSASCRIETATGASLSATKTVSTNSVNVGDQFFYTITVSNTGSVAATGVTVTDPLPPTVTHVSTVASQGSCTGTLTVNCNLGSLAPAASATVTITVRASSGGVAENVATIDSDQTSPVATLIGDPGRVDIEVEQVPTTSDWALIAMASLLAISAFIALKR